jgi:hypothetical protein
VEDGYFPISAARDFRPVIVLKGHHEDVQPPSEEL